MISLFFYLYETKDTKTNYLLMKTSIGIGMRFVLLLVLFLNIFSVIEAFGTEPDGLYVFNRSKIHIEGAMSPFEATIDIKEQGFQKYILNIYLHSAYAAAPPSFNVSVKFPKDKINQIWNSKTWSNKSYFTIPSYDRAAAGFSIISGLTINDHNQITVTCKDAYKAKFVSSNIKEEKDSIVFSLGFFEDDPTRRGGLLRRGGAGHWQSTRGSRCRQRLRQQPRRRAHPVPSSDPGQWRARWLSLGPGTQARVD